MGRVRHIMLAIACMLFLIACSNNPPPKAAPSHPRPSPTSSPASNPASSPTPTATLYPAVADAYKAAAAANPHVHLDLCATTTPLTDQTCGAEFTAASNVATTTEQKLTALDPVTYGPAIDAADKFVNSVNQLELPIPCYGLGSASPPPAPLVSQAQGICTEAAGIAKTEWNVFLAEIDILSGYQPS
jgi:hypothetical protein